MTTTTKLSELTGDYVLDTAHTRIGFAARAIVTKVRGQFGEFEGSAHLDGDHPPKSSAQLTIQAKSIQTRNQQRDDHLRNNFLDTRRLPGHHLHLGHGGAGRRGQLQGHR
jgi:polyisoprenoid-binding protein YceI